MKYQVTKSHRSEYPNPVIVSKGDRLVIGEKSDDNEAWNDWFLCQTEDGVEGWVPKQVIKWLGSNEGEALEDYSAREMDVDEGESLIGTKIMNGWIWCRNPSSNEEGWVPAENLVQV